VTSRNISRVRRMAINEVCFIPGISLSYATRGLIEGQAPK
jgi:hypothetical protein